MKNLVMYSTPIDAHCHAIAWSLRKLGVDVSIISLGDLPDYSNFLWTTEKSVWTDRGAKTSYSQDSLIYYRRRWLAKAPPGAHPDDVRFIEGGCNQITRWLTDYYGIVHKNWVQTPQACRAANNKLVQLKMAKQVGLEIPETLVSNDYDEVLSFIRRTGNCITKPIVPQNWSNEDESIFTFTASVDESDISPDSVALAPMIYQRHVEKQYEYRVVVFDERVVSVRLDPHLLEETALDWRRAVDSNLNAQQRVLSKDTNVKLISLLKLMNLRTGVFDLIVTPDEEVIFLEINESGQFLFLEDDNPNIRMLKEATMFFLKAMKLESTSDALESIHLEDFFEDFPPNTFYTQGVGDHKVQDLTSAYR